jgi:hypothetical protein
MPHNTTPSDPAGSAWARRQERPEWHALARAPVDRSQQRQRERRRGRSRRRSLTPTSIKPSLSRAPSPPVSAASRNLSLPRLVLNFRLTPRLHPGSWRGRPARVLPVLECSSSRAGIRRTHRHARGSSGGSSSRRGLKP